MYQLTDKGEKHIEKYMRSKGYIWPGDFGIEWLSYLFVPQREAALILVYEGLDNNFLGRGPGFIEHYVNQLKVLSEVPWLVEHGYIEEV